MLRDLVPAWRNPVTTNRRVSDHPFGSLTREIDRFFDDFWHDLGVNTSTETGLNTLMTPRSDVVDKGTEFEMTFELPGMTQKDVDVTFRDGMLIVEGEKAREHKDDDTRFYQRERVYGHFYRAIPVGNEIEEDKIKASMHDGILTVTLPKTEEAQKHVKRIEVKS